MADVAEIASTKGTPAYKRTKALLKDPAWRIDNLYWIRDEEGNEIRFVRNAAQRAYTANIHSRDVIVKARRLGFSTAIEILTCDTCVFRSGTKAAIVDVSLKKAREKLAIIAFAYEKLPDDIKAAVSLVKKNTEELHWANGSTVTVGTSHRGGTNQILHVSEYGKISVDRPDAAREIKTGAMRTVHAGGWVAVESTAHGTSGEFHDLVVRSQAKQQAGVSLSPLDFRFHFYGWWVKPEHRIQNNLITITHELREYFDELEHKHGIKTDADQQAWYAQQYADLGPDDVKQEFPSHAGEAFFNSLEGAYFKREMTKARKEGRIGQLVPFDPTRRVNTFWDIGEDCTAIIFHQTDGLRNRIIDYYEEEGSSLQGACAMLEEKKRERGFVYDKHLGPHDMENKDWANQSKSRKKVADELGYKITVVPRIEHKADSIEAARRMLNLTWIDTVHCSLLVERLDNYRKKWNRQLGVFTPEPVHDTASHGSDALQQGAMGLQPDKVPVQDRHRRIEKPRASHWAS